MAFTMKEKRNLSGIYFRCKDEDGSWGNRCFEDLPVEDQKKYIKDRPAEWLESMIIGLSNTLNRIGDQLDLYAE